MFRGPTTVRPESKEKKGKGRQVDWKGATTIEEIPP